MSTRSRRPARDAALRMLADILVPVGLYYGLRAAGLSVYLTLLIAAAVPAAIALIRLVRFRRVDGLAIYVLTIMLCSTGVSLISGSTRFMLAREGWLTGITGLWFLASVRVARPLAYLYSRPLLEHRTTASGVPGDWEQLWSTLPRFRRVWRVTSVLWGLALLADSAIRVIMAYTLPVDAVPALGTALYAGTSLVLIVITNVYYNLAGLYHRNSALYAAPALDAVGSGGATVNPISGDALAGLAGEEYLALTTFRRDGTPVTTPVWAAPADGHLYVYTPVRSGKVRRIRHTPQVTLAGCDFSGTPHGPALPARARVLAPGDLRLARRALTAKYGRRFRWFTIVTLLGQPRRAGGRAVGIDITPR